MAEVVPPGFAAVSLPLQHQLLARTAYITYGIDVGDIAGASIAAANKQVANFVDSWGDELDDQVVVGPAILRIGQDGGDPLSVEGTETGTGDESSAMLPPNCALLMKKSSNLGGRRGRGRCYIPWVVQEAAANDVGIIDPASLLVRNADADSWLAALAAPDGGTPATPMVLLHSTSEISSTPAPSLVIGVSCDSMIGTQRRRLGR